MSTERGIGHHLSQRKGAGSKVSAYGGSLALSDAAMKNVHLKRRLHRDTISTEDEVDRVTRYNYGRRLSLRQEILKIQEDQRRVRYLDGDARHKSPAQWDSIIAMKECVPPGEAKALATYLPFLMEKDWAVCPKAGSLPDLTSIDSATLSILSSNCDRNYNIYCPGTQNNPAKQESECKTLSNRLKSTLPVTVSPLINSSCDDVPASEISRRHVGGVRPHSSVNKSTSQTAPSSSSQQYAEKKKSKKQNKNTFKGHALMYRRKSRSLSDLKCVFPNLNTNERKEGSGEHKKGNSHNFQYLIDAIRTRKEKYQTIGDDQKTT